MSGGRFEVLIADLNGIFRGASLPAADEPADGEIMWPASVFAGRFDGAVVEETGCGAAGGDPDYPFRLIAGTRAPVPWRQGGVQGVFAAHTPAGAPFALDPWHVLAAVLRRFADDGMRALLAAEFEFYLSDDALTRADDASGMCHLYSADELERRADFLDLVTKSAEAQGVPAATVISEYGDGQWEVNLRHTDAARACLDGLLLRRIVRACAARSRRRATFIAKPFAQSSGSGMHLHVSIWRGEKNLFADEDILMHAVAGALSVCAEGMAFFAPYANSYRRFLPGCYAPLTAGWAAENRTAAVRLPHARGDADKRLEFRVCGGDANPVLAAAALLAGVYDGLRAGKPPETPAQKGGELNGARLPETWKAALDALAAARVLPRYMGGDFLRHYGIVKANEWRHHRLYVSDYDRRFYGRVV